MDEETRRRLEEEEQRFEDIYDYEKVFQMVCSNPETQPGQQSKATEHTTEKLLAGSYNDMFKANLVAQADDSRKEESKSILVKSQAQASTSAFPSLDPA